MYAHVCCELVFPFFRRGVVAIIWACALLPRLLPHHLQALPLCLWLFVYVYWVLLRIPQCCGIKSFACCSLLFVEDPPVVLGSTPLPVVHCCCMEMPLVKQSSATMKNSQQLSSVAMLLQQRWSRAAVLFLTLLSLGTAVLSQNVAEGLGSWCTGMLVYCTHICNINTYVRTYVCIEISYDKFPLLLHLILVLFPLEVTSKCFQDM